MSAFDSDSFAGTPDATTRSGGRIVAVVVVLLVLAAGAFAYWRFVYYPTTPQYALREFLDAVREERYDTVYKRLYLTAPLRLVLPSAEAMGRLARDAGGFIPRLQDYHLGRVQVSADRAVIRTVLIAKQPDNARRSSEEVDFEMVRDKDVWKVDGSWALEELFKRGSRELLESLFR